MYLLRIQMAPACLGALGGRFPMVEVELDAAMKNLKEWDVHSLC